jgi:hypothetical protein
MSTSKNPEIHYTVTLEQAMPTYEETTRNIRKEIETMRANGSKNIQKFFEYPMHARFENREFVASCNEIKWTVDEIEEELVPFVKEVSRKYPVEFMLRCLAVWNSKPEQMNSFVYYFKGEEVVKVSETMSNLKDIMYHEPYALQHVDPAHYWMTLDADKATAFEKLETPLHREGEENGKVRFATDIRKFNTWQDRDKVLAAFSKDYPDDIFKLEMASYLPTSYENNYYKNGLVGTTSTNFPEPAWN